MPVAMAVAENASSGIVGAQARPVVADMPALRPFSALRPGVIVIAASTGGPEALTGFFSRLGAFNVPVLVALHMGAPFAEMIVAGIRRRADINAHLASHMETLQPGRVYFAPADCHLNIQRAGEITAAVISKASASCRYKPSADMLFESTARVYGARTLGIVLSGMGDDGCAGAQAICNAGGSMLVQDRASSAVWGMPSAVLVSGYASAELNPQALGDCVASRLLMQRARPAS